MASTSAVAGSPLRRVLMRLGLWGLLKRCGLGWLGRRLVPSVRRRERALRRDLTAFRQRHAYLAAPAGVVASRKLLVASLNDWVAQVKLESILAKALAFQGLAPTIATFSHQVRAHRYHRLFGFHNHAYLDRLVTRAERRQATVATERFLRTRPAFRDVLAFSYRDVAVGRHVLSSIVSNLRSGSVAFDDPEVARLLGSGMVEAMSLVTGAERLLDRVQPDLITLLERGYVPYAEVFEVALNRGIPVIQYTQAHRADAFILKRFRSETRTQHPWSLSPASWEQVRQMPWSPATDADLMNEMRGRYEQGQWFNRKYLQVGKRIKGSDEVRAQLRLDPNKKTAVIFSHVLWDATFFYGTTLFNDYEHWLVETVKAACANPRVNWVVKLHPDYVWKMKLAGDSRLPPEHAALGGKVGALPAHVRLLEPQTDISTYSLFAVTDWCLTVRGTIGFEMPCFGIPVLTAGTGRYSGLGFTIDSASRAEYLERLHHIEDIPPLSPAQTELARRHAHALLRLRPCPFASFTLVQDRLDRLGHALDHNVEMHTQSLAELRDAADLNAFAHWAAHSTVEDFLVATLPSRQVRSA